MRNIAVNQDPAVEAIETREWQESLDYVVQRGGGVARAAELLRQLEFHSRQSGYRLPFTANTPYVNSVPAAYQPAFPGNQALERRIKSLVRWNALSMVVRANKLSDGIGGHISTFASAATLYEVGFNHFFKGKGQGYDGDVIFFQGHAAPGIYSRAFLEGRLPVEKLENFRRETQPGGGLSSYPHPWLMPDFWEYPTVSMGLGPIMAIYQARFMRHLDDCGLAPLGDRKVWAFLGDGETDEPESLGAITLASREKLDNLIFVINCNLQRLDGPVRGNGQIIQELEAVFRGAGWNVVKCLWGSDWDPLFEKDTDGLLTRRLGEIVDGQYQKYSVESGAYIREHLFGSDPRLQALVSHLSDEELQTLRLGGHDPVKVYAAYKAAVEHKGQPTVVLARTVKGYGLGEAGEGKNITHQQKKLNEDEQAAFRERFGIELTDEQLHKSPFVRPSDDSPEMQYLQSRRKSLGGFVPSRTPTATKVTANLEPIFEEFYSGTDDRKASTTMVFVKMLAKMLRDPEIGKLVVPIVPDEARTFGMEALFRQVGIYSHVGQLYEPVDSDTLLYYKEAKDGQIFEEGITEAGSMSTLIAAGTAYATHGINTIPFFIYYSMFGFQRIGDLIWAAADARCRGFLLGGTAGRTTLAGEGLQHQDGHSHVLSLTVPSCMSYDPAFAYEIADHHPGRHPTDVRQRRAHLLLPHGDERAVRDAGDAQGRRRPRGHPEGPVQVPRHRQAEVQAPRAAAGQRRHPAGSDQGAGHSRREVQRWRRHLERDQLQRALSRRARLRSLEPAAPRRDAEGAVCHAEAGGCAGRLRGGLRLPEGAAGHAEPLAAQAHRRARHRRLRPQRSARRPA